MTSETMACAFFAGLIQGWLFRMKGNAKLRDDMEKESERLAKLGGVTLRVKK